jgi:UDP-N-acetylmuramoyl-tripeptide--D-alanyl-D-alanine ligase
MKQKILQFLYLFLAFCSGHYIKRHDIKVIAITGSVWKTSCRVIVSQVLQQIPSSYRFYTSPKNYNSELWLVFSVFQIEDYEQSFKTLISLSFKIFTQSLFGAKKYDVLVAEYGIDSPDDMEHLLKIAVPDIAILTKLDTVHSANFPDGLEQYWEEKWLLLLAAKYKVFVNMQDSFSQSKKHLLEEYSEIFTDVSSLKPQLQNLWNAKIVWNFDYMQKDISINLLGEENIHYTKLALDIAVFLWIYLDRKEYHFNFELQEGRFSIFLSWDNVLIDSSYNAAPESMKQVISNTKKLRDVLYPEHKVLLVLWDMRELGSNTPQAHMDLALYVSFSTGIFTVWPHMYEYLKPELESKKYLWFLKSSLSSREIGKLLKKYLKEHSSQQYIILFKGSQNTIFTEEALAQLLTQSEQKKLPRQTADWKLKKEKFFKGL